MSGFASLFKDSNTNNDNLDKLFSNKSDGPIINKQIISKKRSVVNPPKSSVKKQKLSTDEISKSEQSHESDESDESDEEEEEEEEEVEVKKSKKSDENEDLESKYFDQVLRTESKKETKSLPASQESIKPIITNSEPKVIDFKESELEKSERTIFIGNVPSSVVTNKSISKQFKTLFKKFGKIESVRFRSISFNEILPRKIAFAKKSLHDSRDSINAYIVYEEKPPSLEAVKALNSTIFENHHLRVDHVAHPSPKDNKRTIFVGNLSFDANEEDLWKYFNTKLDNEDVESVRIIRDSKTNLGKGFALVQFKDSLSVNKALLLNDKPMDHDDMKKQRKLRITRAKSNAKPSLLSPNHFENLKKKHVQDKQKQQLNDKQKTKLGRAQSILGKADRSSAGKFNKKPVLEGDRAKKGDKIKGIKGLKTGGKVKKPRLRDRSTKFKNERDSMRKELSKK